MCRRFRFRFRSSQSSRSRCGRGRGRVVALAPLHSDTRHQPPAPFSYSDLARRFASPTVKPSISFSLVPSHRILHSHPPRSLLLPSPISVHHPLLPPSTLTCLPQRNPLTSTSINLDHGQIDFCVVQVRDSGARKQLITRHRHRLFLFCGLFIQSFSSQDRVNEATAVGRKQPKANCQLHPPPQSSRVQPSPALGSLVVRRPLPSAHFNQHPLLTAPPSRSPLALVGTHFLHPTTTRSVASKQQTPGTASNHARSASRRGRR